MSGSKAPPRSLSSRDRVHVLARVNGEQLLELGRGRLAPLPAEPVARLEPALDRADPVRPLGMAEPVSCSSDDGWLKRSGTRAGTVPTRSGRPRPQTLLRTDVAVVGAGAAGLFAALVAAERGREVALVIALAAGAVRELLGAGRDRRRAGRGRLAGPARRGHARGGPRSRPAERGPRAVRGVARRGCASSRRWA